VRRVITVSLNGNAFQLEDDACAALSAYLDEAARALSSNPDRAEIISDLEQAIADKCAAYLNAHKGVMTRSEIEQVIAQMGPVDADPGATPGAHSGVGSGSAAPNSDDARAAPRRLYQISEGAMISGICNGYAAYSGIDVTWVRVIFVLLIVFTGGAALIAYLVLMFIIPYASTSEEHAAAHGLPFNARLLVENAKRHYSQFANSDDWRKEKESIRNEWRRARASWRLERRRAREEWRNYRRYAGHGGVPPTPPPAGAPPAPTPYMAHVMSGTVMAILGLLRAVIGIFMILAILSLINTHAIFGWSLPYDIPLWVDVVGVIIVWSLITKPIRVARRSAYWYSGAYHVPWFAAFDGVVVCAIFIGVGWWGVHHVPEIREFFQNLPRLWDDHDSWSNTAARLIVKACTAMKDLLLWVSRQG
jgi:phage shock protein PspC (stress-responsive transcriptional regulator)